MASMTIFDNRLLTSPSPPPPAGTTPPNLANNTFIVDQSWSITNAFLWVKNFADLNDGVIPRVNIMCHGYYAWSESEALQASMMVGGFGLELCNEGLLSSNIDLIVPLVKDKLGDVLIFACGAASDQAGASGLGGLFCAKLSMRLNCVVYAADRKQLYSWNPGTPGPMWFQEWQGTVWRFTPDGVQVAVGRYPSANPT